MRDAPRVGCAILAAGAGVRYGAPGAKLTATFGGKALVQHAIDAACTSKAAAVTLVLGAAYERVLAFADTRRSAVAVNAGWIEGIASSIRTALALRQDVDACIFMLGDQPHVEPADLDAMIDAFARDRRAIVALRRERVWGAPILFPALDFSALSRLNGDAGAKRHAQAQVTRLAFVRARSADAFADVDSPLDLTHPDDSRTRRTRRSPVRR